MCPIPAIHGVLRCLACDLILRCLSSSASRCLSIRLSCSVRPLLRTPQRPPRPTSCCRCDRCILNLRSPCGVIRHSLAPERRSSLVPDELLSPRQAHLSLARGIASSAAHDQRTLSTYLFGALCPVLGTGAAFVLPFCYSAPCSFISTRSPPSYPRPTPSSSSSPLTASSSSLTTSRSSVPPRSPNSTPTSQFTQILQPLFKPSRYLDHCCYASNTLINQPWKIKCY